MRSPEESKDYYDKILGDSGWVKFWNKLDMSSGCYLWIGETRNGRGRFRVNGSYYPPIKILYELRYGSLEDHEDLYPICGQETCVNPDHLKKRQNPMKQNDALAAEALSFKGEVTVLGRQYFRALDKIEHAQDSTGTYRCPMCQTLNLRDHSPDCIRLEFQKALGLLEPEPIQKPESVQKSEVKIISKRMSLFDQVKGIH